jgi:RNA-directed DNA polymerase
MSTTETQKWMDTKLQRVAWLSRQDSKKEFKCLMHYFNEESLGKCFQLIDGRKAKGIDGVDKESYGKNLSANLKGLVSRMKTMSYLPGNIRQVLIPKEGEKNSYRPLGISNFEDKLVQKGIQQVLESVYEPIFLSCSFGFRPGKGCHDALREMVNHLYKRPVSAMIDIDLANFFGSINHKELEQVVRIKIKDKRLMRYIIRMLKAGVLTNGELRVSEEGTSQGSICSPILANIFAHYVIDEWFEEVVKKHCRGEVKLVRYCDDMAVACQYEEDAIRIRRALGKRLAKFGLKLNEEKTKVVKFSRNLQNKATFNFLGFSIYWGASRNGKKIPKVKTMGKRMSAKLNRVSAWMKEVRNKYKLKEIWKVLILKLEGHIQYYGVSDNLRSVTTFLYQTKCIVFKWLNRRSQRKSFTWEKFNLFVEANPLPKGRVCYKLY